MKAQGPGRWIITTGNWISLTRHHAEPDGEQQGGAAAARITSTREDEAPLNGRGGVGAPRVKQPPRSAMAAKAELAPKAGWRSRGDAAEGKGGRHRKRAA